VLRLDPTLGILVTHNGQAITRVSQWLLDEDGQLYAQTNLGAARIDDRDLGILANCLSTSDSRNLLEVLEQSDLNQTPANGLSFFDQTEVFAALAQPASFLIVLRKELPGILNFVANPTDAPTQSAALALK
jgi:ligand-binding sensor domain-containing protein